MVSSRWPIRSKSIMSSGPTSRRLRCRSISPWPMHPIARATFSASPPFSIEACAMTGTERTASELLSAQAQGESAEAITQASLNAIRQRDPQVKAFLHVEESLALEQARGVDAKRKRGEALGKLAGV